MLAKSKSQQSNSETKEYGRTTLRGTAWLSRALVMVALDVLCVMASYLFALVLRFDFAWDSIPAEYLQNYAMLMPLAVVYVLATMWVFRLYHSVWRFVSISELMRLLMSWFIDALMLPTFAMILGLRMPASFWIVGAMAAFFATTGVRFSYRLLRRLVHSYEKRGGTRVMVVGAGECGRALIREIALSPQLGMSVRCVVDDNPSKWGRFVEGVPIVGGRMHIAAACAQYGIEQIVFAIPSCSNAERKEILELCTKTGLEVRAMPGIYQLVGGTVSVSRLRHVRLEDLLGREPVVVDAREVRSYVEGRVVLVTGGGGSIGSELCRQIAKDDPRQLIIFDIYENNAYAIQQELKKTYPELDLVVLIGSVRDFNRVNATIAAYRPDAVFHAAAHKHVPLMEESPHEAIKNNVLGTLNCARASVQNGVHRFLLISTDKAVNPTNVMGATKRLCEMVIQAEERRARRIGAQTPFSAVRFGNVLGSNGSVVPLFEKQIEQGGPVTVTHPEITRFFMTIPEAVSLVLQSACYAKGGEIFVLDMGEPVRIDDMARNLIRLSGYEPDVEIPVVYTGLRPGEKLYEERLMGEEGLRKTENTMISVARPMEIDDEALERDVRELVALANDEEADVRPKLQQVVGTYHPELGG